MKRCKDCGREFDPEALRDAFESNINGLSYDDIDEDVCLYCAVESVKDIMPLGDFGRCSECGCGFEADDLFFEEGSVEKVCQQCGKRVSEKTVGINSVKVFKDEGDTEITRYEIERDDGTKIIRTISSDGQYTRKLYDADGNEVY